MQFWHLIFMAFFANYYSLNQTTECVNLLSKFNGKLRPSFDEIFGKGWDKEEKKQQKMDKSAQQNNGQMGEENGEENSISIDQMNDSNKMGISDQKGKDRSDQEKRVIIEKFELIKKKLTKIGESGRKRSKIERQIGKQLGVSRDKIYQWKKEMGENKKNNKHYYEKKKREFIERLDEFKEMLGEKIAEELGINERTLRKWKRQMGIGTMRKSFSDQEKRETIEKFHLMREKLKEIGKYPYRKRAKIERQIGRQLGTNRDKIFKWKRELGIGKMRKCHSDWEKRAIIEKFHLIKEKLKDKEEFEKSKWVKIERQIGRQLGTNRDKIYKWKKELGIQKMENFSDQQKRVTIEKFHLLRQKLKEMGQFPYRKRGEIERQIGNELGVCRKRIYKWKRELEIKGMEEKGTNSMRN